jgi:hypothetical protein
MILTTLRSSLTFSLASASLGLGAAMMALAFFGYSGSNKALYLGCCSGAFLSGFVS